MGNRSPAVTAVGCLELRRLRPEPIEDTRTNGEKVSAIVAKVLVRDAELLRRLAR